MNPLLIPKSKVTTRKAAKQLNAPTIEQIESIQFHHIGCGDFPYWLKRVEIKSPLTNVYGFFHINGEYYEKVYKP